MIFAKNQKYCQYFIREIALMRYDRMKSYNIICGKVIDVASNQPEPLPVTSSRL